MTEHILNDAELWPDGIPDSWPEEIPDPDGTVPRAYARDCAVETGPGELPGPVPSPGSLDRIRLWWVQTVVPAATAVAAKQGTLADSQPPTFRQARARHHECAGHYTNRFGRGQRVAYGYLHMATVKPALNYLEWATESELRAAIHILLAAAAWVLLLWAGLL